MRISSDAAGNAAPRALHSLRTDVAYWQILLQKSAAADGRSATCEERPALIHRRCALYATPTLRDALNPGGWRPRDQRCEPSQVLSDGKHKLILGAMWATQSQSTKPQDALQVGEPHLSGGKAQVTPVVSSPNVLERSHVFRWRTQLLHA